MSKPNYYDVLGVPKTATPDEIKKAYRKLAIKYHPDKTKGDKAKEEKFKEVAEAYETLGNEDKKTEYDNYGIHSFTERDGSDGMDFNDIFGKFQDIFGRHFGDINRTQSNRGENLIARVQVSLSEIANGISKKIRINKKVVCTPCGGNGSSNGNSWQTCNNCKGTGQSTQVVNTILGRMQTNGICSVCGGEGQVTTAICNSCNGNGVVMGSDSIDITIPAGVEDGTQLRLVGKGGAGKKGAMAGDLTIQIVELEHEFLKREGLNINYDHYISFMDATLGCSAEIPTLEGKVKINIEAGGESIKILRLKGKGLPDINNLVRGDMFISINVFIPIRLTTDEKALVEKLRYMGAIMHPEPNRKYGGFFDKLKRVLTKK